MNDKFEQKNIILSHISQTNKTYNDGLDRYFIMSLKCRFYFFLKKNENDVDFRKDVC